MRVILIRHGHDLRTPAGESSLSRQGRKSVRETGDSLSASGYTHIDLLLTSPSRRARETAAELADVITVSNELVTENLAPGSSAECLDELLIAYPRHQSVVIAVVGHEPQLSEAALGWCGFRGNRISSTSSRWVLPRGEAMVVSLAQGDTALSTYDWPVDARGIQRPLLTPSLCQDVP